MIQVVLPFSLLLLFVEFRVCSLGHLAFCSMLKKYRESRKLKLCYSKAFFILLGGFWSLLSPVLCYTLPASSANSGGMYWLLIDFSSAIRLSKAGFSVEFLLCVFWDFLLRRHSHTLTKIMTPMTAYHPHWKLDHWFVTLSCRLSILSLLESLSSRLSILPLFVSLSSRSSHLSLAHLYKE